jgi:hypothetical protein
MEGQSAHSSSEADGSNVQILRPFVLQSLSRDVSFACMLAKHQAQVPCQEILPRSNMDFDKAAEVPSHGRWERLRSEGSLGSRPLAFVLVCSR